MSTCLEAVDGEITGICDRDRKLLAIKNHSSTLKARIDKIRVFLG